MIERDALAVSFVGWRGDLLLVAVVRLMLREERGRHEWPVVV